MQEEFLPKKAIKVLSIINRSFSDTDAATIAMKTKLINALVKPVLLYVCGGTVASWLVRSSLDRVIWVPALASDIVLCSWARHFTLTVPLSTQVCKWVPAKLMLGVTLRWTGIPSGGSRNTLSRFMLRKPG